VDANRKTLIRLSEDVRDGFGRVAAKGNFNKSKGGGQVPPQFGGEEGGGGVPPQFGKGGGFGQDNTGAKRQIPENHEFDEKAIKPIVKSLWAMSVALGHALTAHRQFSRLKSSTFSPDGLLGGRGYVMPIKEIRQQLFEACENLSGLVDTLHDEINAPHWKPKLADLEKADMAEVERLLSDAEEWVDNPEEEEDKEIGDIKDNASWNKDRSKKDDGIPRSDIPSGGDKETVQKSGPNPGSPDHPNNKALKNASTYTYDRTANTPSIFDVELPIPALPPEVLANVKRPEMLALFRRLMANSSVDPGTLPGPRVDHLDRADTDQTGPGGSVNQEDPKVRDEWGQTDGVSGVPSSQNTGDGYNYPSAWSGDESNTYTANYDRTATGWENPTQPWVNPESPKASSSGVPDSNSDSTPTQAWDFGIGDGNGNDAHGQGAGGYGVSNPSAPDSNPGGGEGNRGVYGPQAELPGDPGAPLKDRSKDDGNVQIEQGIGNNSVPSVTAAYRFADCSILASVDVGTGKLPNDDEDPVARSDYYRGDKGNDFNTDGTKSASPSEEAESKTPGNESRQPPAPSTHRPMSLYEHEFASGSTATSEDPGDGGAGTYDSAPGYGPDEWHRTEQVDEPYVTYDDNTHNMKPDETYQRGDLPAPYVNQHLA
jgi:hypothetical protein